MQTAHTLDIPYIIGKADIILLGCSKKQSHGMYIIQKMAYFVLLC